MSAQSQESDQVFDVVRDTVSQLEELTAKLKAFLDEPPHLEGVQDRD